MSEQKIVVVPTFKTSDPYIKVSIKNYNKELADYMSMLQAIMKDGKKVFVSAKWSFSNKTMADRWFGKIVAITRIITKFPDDQIFVVRFAGDPNPNCLDILILAGCDTAEFESVLNKVVGTP